MSTVGLEKSNTGPDSRAVRTADSIGGAVSAASLAVQGVALCVLVPLVLVAIVVRYVLNGNLAYENPLMTLLLVWIIFAGLGRASWIDNLLRVNLWKNAQGFQREAIAALSSGATLVFYVLLVDATISSASTYFTTVIPDLGLSSIAQSASIGLGAAVGVVLVLLRMVADGKSWRDYLLTGFVAVLVWVGVVTGIPSGAGVLVALVAMMILDVPVAIALGLAGASVVFAGNLSTSITVLMDQALGAVSNIAFLALPLFMVLGGVVARTGLADDLGSFLKFVFRRVPGGVGLSCVGAAAVLANMTGSPIADTAALGTVFLPELIKSGYSRAEAAALQACAGLLGMVFPPAVILILYATLVNVSVTAEFAAVIIPGVLLTLVMMIVVVIRALLVRRVGKGAEVQTDSSGLRDGPRGFQGLLRVTGRASPVLAIPVILDFGIFSGIFAPYEAGAVAILTAVVAGASMGHVRLRDFVGVVRQAADTTVLVMFILASVGILEYGLFTSGTAGQIDSVLAKVVSSVVVFWIVVNLAFMVLHEFVEPFPAILLLLPFLVPLAAAVHVGLIQLGIVIVVNSTIGLVLPPLGVNLYVAAKIGGAEPNQVLRHVWPYLVGSLGVLALVCAWPALTAL
ncbi:MAG TPA: TRAP transporter large permease [Candidatus Dormibacteraeota bacterium]|nr:TRAP transporter large permease [Candidatus Dormibacteraeota bacterium]